MKAISDLTSLDLKKAISEAFIDPRLYDGITDYLRLVNCIQENKLDESFEKLWCQFYVLRTSKAWNAQYFRLLRQAIKQPITLQVLLHQLYQHPVNSHGHQRIQLSFATKLLHHTNPRLPIYDSLVCKVFNKVNLQLPSPTLPEEQRIKEAIQVFQRLQECFNVLLGDKEIAEAVDHLVKQYPDLPRVKALDFLLWRAGAAATKKSSASSIKIIQKEK